MTRIIHRLARLFIAAACLGELAVPAGTLPLSENARKMDANGQRIDRAARGERHDRGAIRADRREPGQRPERYDTNLQGHVAQVYATVK